MECWTMSHFRSLLWGAILVSGGTCDKDCLPGLLSGWGSGTITGKGLQHTTVYKVTWWL